MTLLQMPLLWPHQLLRQAVQGRRVRAPRESPMRLCSTSAVCCSLQASVMRRLALPLRPNQISPQRSQRLLLVVVRPRDLLEERLLHHCHIL